MSLEKPKPFAVVRPETSVADAEGFSVVIEGYECCPPWGNWSAQGSADYAAAINAAVAAERRDAVVAKLREAAADLDAYADLCQEVGDDDKRVAGIRVSAGAIRGRADAVEMGEA